MMRSGRACVILVTSKDEQSYSTHVGPSGWQVEDFLAIAKEFVRRGVNFIVAGHTLSARAAKEATQTIPIVVAAMSGADPVELGFAKSIGRPGYNITGMSLQTSELPGKRLELIKEIVSTASRIAILLPDTEPYRSAAKDREPPAKALGVKLLYLEVNGPGDLKTSFEQAKRGQADAVVLVQSALFYSNSKTIAELAFEHRLPVLSGESGFAAAGGIINHGPNISDSWRRSAAFVDKILKGAKPGDLPIEQPTKFELVINLKTAKVLGLTIPQSILVRADEVIE
jgi:ABC-type uncharacterized transport system substrate-binding protein